MIDLPDYGYVMRSIQPIDPGGALPGTLGGPSDYMSRPGYRYAVTYQLRELPSAYEARRFEALLERGSQEDVSYPFPLDFAPGPSCPLGGIPLIHLTNPAGGSLLMNGLLPFYQFKMGQPFSVQRGGLGYIHRAAESTFADSEGHVTVPVFPLTRITFGENDVVEIQKPRIRGILTWEGSDQPAYGRRAFRFTITERR
jgi:hypothetical protein